MIKISYIIGQLMRGGAEKQLYELVRCIDKNKFEPIVVSLSQGGDWTEKIREANVQVIELERKKNNEVARLYKLIKLLKEIKPQIVHTYLFSANSYGRIAAVLNRTPIIIASERSVGEIGKDKKKYMIYIDKLLSYFSDGIICNSEYCSNNLTKKYSFNRKKIFTVHNGINLNNFLKEFNINNENKSRSKIIGTIGSLYSHKNHKLFLDMAKIILDSIQNKNIDFLVIGDGPLRNELEIYSERLGIQKSVIFTGNRSDIPRLLKKMDIFVMTSLYEGMSNAIMEAMIVELPVVATDVGGNRELVINGVTGFLCPPDNAQSLAEKINYLLKNGEDARQMGERGRNRIEEDFSVEKMIKEIEGIYYKLLDQKL
jgi:glycosyltransferase involved in cell wall biosynthesis